MTGEHQDSLGRLLDRHIPDDLLRERTLQVARPKDVVRRGIRSIVIFRIEEEWLALPTEVFKEAVENCTLHTLPHRRGGILSGLVNVRGDLLICVRLDGVLGRKSPPSQTHQPVLRHVLVCNRKGERLAFPVSEIVGVHRYDSDDLRKVPATLSNSAAGAFAIGMVAWNGRTVGCLDDELVFYAISKNLL